MALIGSVVGGAIGALPLLVFACEGSHALTGTLILMALPGLRIDKALPFDGGVFLIILANMVVYGILGSMFFSGLWLVSHPRRTAAWFWNRIRPNVCLQCGRPLGENVSGACHQCGARFPVHFR